MITVVKRSPVEILENTWKTLGSLVTLLHCLISWAYWQNVY